MRCSLEGCNIRKYFSEQDEPAWRILTELRQGKTLDTL